MEEGSRRLAAIMFTDMVGYTTLGQRNESLSLALVEEQKKVIRPVLARHNGREVKTIGDAFLVEFPNALEAVRCAYDIQRATREFNFSLPEDRRVHLRIGVHIGDVVESGGDISGDAVNIASRIEPLAEDGGVCLSRQVYDQIANKFELPLVSLGPKSLKNVVLSVETYRMSMPWEKEWGASAKGFDERRIAVLPFANLNPDPTDEYFADGMTEELITSLSGVKGLTVIARTSVMRYKKGTKTASEVAKELNVGTIVEGSVRKAGNKVRITTQLIDARSEGHIWARNYDKQLDDIFAIQTDVAEKVVEALQVKLMPLDKKRLARSPTSNIEAYTLYLKGRYYANRASEKSFRTAITHQEEAIANDPEFALAYSELAFCYNSLGFFGMLSSKEAGERSRAYVKKALELDPSLAEAHLVLGRILRNYDWDFAGAENEYALAIELNQNFADAYGTRGILMMFERRIEEAISDAERALELDPLSDLAAQYAGTIYLYSGRHDEAMDQFRRALEIDPDNSYARNNFGLAHVERGDFDKGIAEMEKVSTLKNPSTQSDLAYAYATAGRVDDAKKLLSILLTEVENNHELAVAVASAYANLGDLDNAFKWLERAYEERVAYLISANNDFIFDCIRSNPRFKALMEKIGYSNT